MPAVAMLGRHQTVVHEVTVEDLVTTRGARYREVEKAPVLPTSVLLWWAERACMVAMGGFSLGVRVDIKHLAPVVLGSTVTIDVECTWAAGQRSEWTMSAKDQAGVVSSGVLSFVRADRDVFLARRVRPKLAALPAAHEMPGWFTSACDNERWPADVGV